MSKLNIEEEVLKNARVALDVAGRVLNVDLESAAHTAGMKDEEIEGLAELVTTLADRMRGHLDQFIPGYEEWAKVDPTPDEGYNRKQKSSHDCFEEQLGDHA